MHRRPTTRAFEGAPATCDRNGRGPVAAGELVPGFALIALCSGAAFALGRVVGLSPLVVATGLGALLANVGLVPHRAGPGLRFASKRLLRVGIVLLGFQLALDEVVELGGRAVLVVVVIVVVTFLGTQWLGRRLRVPPGLALLVAAGYAICGASAIAAMEGVVDATEEEVAFSVALVTLCGSLAIVVLPLLALPLGLDGRRFGVWIGGSVHDVAQVVATASTAGQAGLETAVVVKLTRVVLLAPLLTGVAVARRRSDAGAPGSGAARPPLLPLFVVGFLGTAALRSLGAVPSGWLPALATGGKVSLAAALVALGAGVQVAAFRRIGTRPLVLGMLAWILVAFIAYLGVLVVG